MSQFNGRNCSRFTRPSGLTLVEVLVALVVTALALMGGLKLFQTTAESLRLSQMRSLGLICTDNEVLKSRINPTKQQLGSRSETCNQSGLLFVVESSVLTTPHLNFRRLEVRAKHQGVTVAERIVFLPMGF